jgi:ATP-binding cassette, subfamily C, bacterial LapB
MRTAIKRQWRRLRDALARMGARFEPIRTTCSGTGAAVAEPTVSFEIHLASLIINLLALGLPLVSLQVYDRVIPNRGHETLAFLIVGLTLVLAFDLALRTTRLALVNWHAMRFVRLVEHEAVIRLLHAPHGTIESEPVVVHVNRFAALAALGRYHASRLMAVDILFVFVTLAIVAVVGGRLVLVPIAMFFFFAALAIHRTRDFPKINEERSIRDNKKYDFVAEVLTGILTVKGMAMEPQMLRRFERLQQSVAEITMQSIFVSQTAQSSAVIFGSLSQIIVVAFGAVRVIDGQMSIGALVCCTMLSGQVLQPLLRAISIWGEITIVGQRRSEVRKLLALPAVELSGAPTPTIDGAVRFDRVSYERPGQKPTIRNITLSVPAGTVVGLMGGTGSGSMTLLQLLLGDLVPTTGRITVDDIATTDRAFANVRPFLAYVGPEPVKFRGTILDNLTMFQSHRRSLARQMAMLIGLEESVNGLPKGYDTEIGDSAAESLPASIAQQMTIVRALSTGPRVLVLNNTNTLLDRRAEAALIEAIDKLRGGLTLFMATDRPSVLAKSDVVYRLAEGQLTESRIVAAPGPSSRGVA